MKGFVKLEMRSWLKELDEWKGDVKEFQKVLSLLKWDNGALVKYKIKIGMKAAEWQVETMSIEFKVPMTLSEKLCQIRSEQFLFDM